MGLYLLRARVRCRAFALCCLHCARCQPKRTVAHGQPSAGVHGMTSIPFTTRNLHMCDVNASSSTTTGPTVPISAYLSSIYPRTSLLPRGLSPLDFAPPTRSFHGPIPEPSNLIFSPLLSTKNGSHGSPELFPSLPRAHSQDIHACASQSLCMRTPLHSYALELHASVCACVQMRQREHYTAFECNAL